MSKFRSFMGWGAAVVCALSVSVAGCKKKDDAKDGDKSEKATKDDEGGKKKKDGDDKYATGTVLKHLPKACKGGRIYVNVGLFLKNEAVEKATAALEDKFAEKMKKKDSKQLSKALKSLKKSGIDPAHDVKEVAFCFEPGMKEGVAAIGGNFAGKDPIGAIEKAADESGEKDLEKKEADGVEYVKSGKDFIASVAPNVLVITKTKADFADLKAGDGSDEGWDVDKGRILSFFVNDKKSGKFNGTITESGEDLDVKFTGDFSGDTGEKIEDDPKQFKKQFEAMRDQFETKLKKGPFKKIADDIGSAKIKVDGSKVTVTMTLPSSDLGDAIKKAADMDEDELQNAVDL
jgi:hypothetical protein